MTDFQKEALAAMREITLQLILIAAAILSLGAGFLTARDQPVQPAGIIWTSFVLFIASILSGILTYGALIDQLRLGSLNLTASPLLWLSRAQWGLFVLGSVAVFIFAVANV
jgi:hypothetical protein